MRYSGGMNIGDKGTISRGRNAGQTGTILGIDTANDKLAVQWQDGSISTVSKSAFKEPQAAVVKVADVIAALNEAQLPANDEITGRVLDHLGKLDAGIIDGVQLAQTESAGY